MFFLLPGKKTAPRPGLACPECGKPLSTTKTCYECAACKKTFTHSELMHEYSLLARANQARRVHQRCQIDLACVYMKELEAERAKVKKLESELAALRAEHEQWLAETGSATILQEIGAIKSRLDKVEAFRNDYINAHVF